MYRHCFHCNGTLGTNAAIAALPIGRRIAFDAERGRVWVICPRCARWNLVPFEGRLDALAQCEARFVGTRLRRSTANVGLARLDDGTELVRIGARVGGAELAAWRYGAVFSRRRRRAMWGLSTTASAGTLAMLAAVVPQVGAGVAGVGWTFLRCGRSRRGVDLGPCAPWQETALWLLLALFFAAGALGALALGVQRLLLWRTVARVRLSTGRDFLASFAAAERTCVAGWSRETLRVRVPMRVGSLVDLLVAPEDDPGPATRVFEGSDALLLLRTVLPLVNDEGGDDETIARAWRWLDAHPSVDAILDAMYGGPRSGPPVRVRGRTEPWRPDPRIPLTAESRHRALALEMALEAEDEARWMAGELDDLAAQWREAEEVAAIADRLLLPAAITERVAALRARGRAPDAPTEDGTPS